MVRRNYGRGSNADDATLREQLMQLLSGGVSGGGGGRSGGRGGGGGGKGGGGGRGGGGNAAAARPPQSRQGDWECTQCHFTNFAFRRSCLRCQSSAVGQPQRTLSAAHTGALRPQQMARPAQRPATAAEARSAAARAGQPSYHVPRPAAAAGGASSGGEPAIAARAMASGSSSSAANSSSAAGQPADSDAAARRTLSGPHGPAAAPSIDTERNVACPAQPRRGRWADDVPPCDRMQDDADGDESVYADDDVEYQDVQEEEDNAWDNPPPSAETLRARWAAECRVVRALEKVEWDIGQGQSAALHAAQRARDRAESEWRNAVAPKPVAVRMGAAQRKVNKAQKAVDRASADLQEFEEVTAQRREELRGALQHAEDRRDQRQKELDDLHREAGAIASAGVAREADGAAETTGAERMLDEMVREVQAIVETLDEGSPARGRANLLLAKVASMPGHTGTNSCQSFDIATDADEQDCGRSGRQATARRARGGPNAPGAAPARREVVWNEAAGGRWCKHRQEADGAAANGRCTNGADVTAGSARDTTARAAAAATTTDAPQHISTSAEGAAASQGSAAPIAAVQSGKGGRPAPSGDCDSQPPNKSHRGHDVVEETSVEGACDDAARALKLMGEQDAAIKAAQAANATFGDQVSMQIAGQLYAHKVQLAVDRAKAAGVQPEVGGKQLIQLPPDAFNRWVTEVLAPAELARRDDEEKEL